MLRLTVIALLVCLALAGRALAHDRYDDIDEDEMRERLHHDTPSMAWYASTGTHPSLTGLGPGGVPNHYMHDGPMPHTHHRSPLDDYISAQDNSLPHFDAGHQHSADHSRAPSEYHHDSSLFDDEHVVPVWMDRAQRLEDEKSRHLGGNTAQEKLRRQRERKAHEVSMKDSL